MGSGRSDLPSTISLGRNRDFAGLCAEHVAFDAYKVTDVKQFLEHHIVEVFVFARTDFVAVHIDWMRPLES